MVSGRDLEDQLLDSLHSVIHAVPEGKFDWDSGVMVGDFDVGLAARCQAAASRPAGDFVPDVFNSFKTLARSSVRRVNASGGVRRALLAQLQALRTGDTDMEQWVSEYLTRCDQVILVEIVHRAATWLHRTAQVLGDDALVRHGPGGRVTWDHPDNALRLRATVDLIADDDNVAVMVVPSLDDARRDQVAYVAMLFQLTTKAAPDRVRIVVHSTGELIEVEIDDLVGRALSSTAQTVQAVAARSVGPDGLHRSASFFTCRDCCWFDDCSVRIESEARTPSVRQGIRLPR